MEFDTATSALLEKLRLESRKALLLDRGADAAYSSRFYQDERAQEQNAASHREAWASMNPHQRHEEVVRERARENNNNNNGGGGGGSNNAASSAIESTRMEQHLRLEIEAMHERIRQLENSLAYERERHAQTRELLRIALKPPPEESAAIARQEERRRNGSQSPARGGGRGASSVPIEDTIAAAMYGLDARQAAAEQQQQQQQPADQLAKYARVEVYSGSVTPSRVAMMMYAQAHELDHSPAASKEVLQQVQGGMAQVQQQHQHQQLSDGSALLAAHHQGMRQQQQQDGHTPMSQQQHQQHGGGGGNVRGSATPNGALRSRSPGGFSRSSTPSARPFGIGERRFHPLAAIGHTNVMATSGGQLLRADDVRRTPNRTGTPARRSPAATLRSPAQTYAAWA